MLVEKDVHLQPYNTFGIVAKANALLRISSEKDLLDAMQLEGWQTQPKLILGGGSNIVITGDVKALVLKVEIRGFKLLHETDKAYVVEAGAGESWHELVCWTLENGYYGLENMALIPGSVGASPVQNIGAYGVELQDRFDSLDGIDLETGQLITINAAQCGFGYRDSVFKHHSSSVSSLDRDPIRAGAINQRIGLKDRVVIVRVRFYLPKNWKPVLGYSDIAKKIELHGSLTPTAQQIFDWVCEIRRAKLPDPVLLGNAGSFFKNPTVSPEQCSDIIAREPNIVYYRLDDGTFKLAAGWLIDACGWKGKTVGQAAVYEKQALVLVNKGGATGGEVMTLAVAIQTSVYERFGIMLEPEPVVV